MSNPISAKFRRFSAWSFYLAIIALYAFSLWGLFTHRTDETFWSLAETWRIVQYSAGQALISALSATLLGLLTARSFFYLPFKGKALLYKLLAFVWSLPALIVIFALIGVWGNNGWLAQCWRLIGLEWHFSLYGLQGIVLAHLFLNIPLVMKYCLEGLNLIPSSSHQLAAQLNLTGWHYFRIVELPVLSGILPYAFGTVFLLCFTSFPIVLMLGGGPKYSTLEVAIYQAVTFEFDFAKAVILILVQVAIGILLQLLMLWASRRAFEQQRSKAVIDTIWRAAPQGTKRFLSAIFLLMICTMIFVPLLNVVLRGISALNWQRLLAFDLVQAVWFSLLLALISGITAVGVSYLLALEHRQLVYHQQKVWQSILSSVVTLPLILPVFLLSVGLFLLLMWHDLNQWQLILLIGICNGLTLLPFIYHLIFSAMWQSLKNRDKLARSLGLKGFQRWWIVEKNALIRPLAQAFALAISASLGSFTIIAFFGNPDFATLPYLLYQQLGNYRTEEAAVTALLLLLCALLPFLAIKQKGSL